jgi:hypothetical protein
MNLSDFAENVHSQHGEDGIIQKILEWLGMKKGHCVEFGAWDGYKFSNTANLWEPKDSNWTATLLEGDPAKFVALKENMKLHPNVKAAKRMVGIEPDTRWWEVAPRDSDIVSIDVDGNDYYIFLDSPRGPKLYIVEYNTTIPAWLDVWTPYAKDNYFGCSLKALERVAQAKGYAYIGSTRSNGFFLRDDLLGKVPKELDRDLRHAANQDDLTYLITSYAGEFKETRIGPYGRTRYYEKEVLSKT